MNDYSSPAQGSTGNVIAALSSFFLPGLGQLIQGRMGKALVHFILAGVIWVISFGWLGWIMHCWSAYEAAKYDRSYDF
ncbi:MAG: hypothetical protein KDA80_15875 [Planctomycetaceae bacterium]|nr:hypothetical protein [Planctomycetaceae bacterium]